MLDQICMIVYSQEITIGNIRYIQEIGYVGMTETNRPKGIIFDLSDLGIKETVVKTSSELSRFEKRKEPWFFLFNKLLSIYSEYSSMDRLIKKPYVGVVGDSMLRMYLEKLGIKTVDLCSYGAPQQFDEIWDFYACDAHRNTEYSFKCSNAIASTYKSWIAVNCPGCIS